MPPVEERFEEDPAEQFRHYRKELQRQFFRNCLGYSIALSVLLYVSSIAVWSLCAAAFWTLMLVLEATSAFNGSETTESCGFRRWQSRQSWIAAGHGDRRSLKRLQNVQ